MRQVKPDAVIPPQYSGAETNTEDSIVTNTIEEAKDLFASAKERLFNVNNWGKISGPVTAQFQLTDAKGTPVKRLVQQGDYFRIDIPGPGPVAGEGYDWVQIEKIEENSSVNEDIAAIKVRPARDPQTAGNEVAHFFSDEATSSFVVMRNINTVIAGIYGRNESPNTQSVNTVDKARNAMIGLTALAGFSKIQWKNLVKGLLESRTKEQETRSK